MALVPYKIQCKGFNKSGLQCCNMITNGTHCTLHSDQDVTAPPVLRCGGETIDGTRCSNLVRKGTFDQPALCTVHKRAQKRRPVQLKYIICFGKEAGGQRCKASVPWKPPYSQFCLRHEDQAASFGSPVTNLPQELVSMIVANLAPIERVSFALANRSCTRAVRAWGETTRPRTMLRAHDLTFISPVTDDVLNPFPEPVLLYTFGNDDQRTLVQMLNSTQVNPNLAFIIAVFMIGIHKVACKGVEFKIMSKSPIPGMVGDRPEHWDNYFAVSRLTGLRGRVAKAIERYPYLFPPPTPGCLFCGSFAPAPSEPPFWMCHECEHAEIFVPWCEKCSGPLPILALARSIGVFYRSHLNRLQQNSL